MRQAPFALQAVLWVTYVARVPAELRAPTLARYLGRLDGRGTPLISREGYSRWLYAAHFFLLGRTAEPSTVPPSATGGPG